jgi:hypothetical protein
MARAKLKFDEREIAVGEDPITFGRTSENTVSFTDNPNISRRHAEIKYSGGEFVVTDLGSSNGTTINGQKIGGETVLNDGDFVTIGNSVVVEFILEERDEPAAAEESPSAVNGNQSNSELKSADESGKSSRLPVMLGVAGAVCGLAIVFAVAAVYVAVSNTTPECNASARFLSPVNGQTLTDETEIRVELTDASCVSVVHVMLNGKEIASLSEAPYTAQVDPKNYPELADGGLYPLQIVLEDSEGNAIPQSRDIALQFETKEIEPPPTVTPVETATPAKTPQGKQPSVVEMQKMTAAVVAKFSSGSFKYNLSDPEFLREVQKKTADYAVPGYYQRAAGFQERINLAFVREKNLDASLAYILAMSRSKFTPEKQGANEGLWQMSNDFAAANAYNAICGTQTLSEPTQECAAKAAALYLEDLVIKVFDGDIVYGVASFGKTSQEAITWKNTLPVDRSNFWKAITDQAQREEVAKFFAAAVVAENPRRFGLKTERPISELYPPRTN